MALYKQERLSLIINEIEQLTPDRAEELYRKIAANLPEYFGLSESNKNYAKGVHSQKYLRLIIYEIS